MAVDVQTSMNYYLDPSKGGITAYVPGTAGILRRKFDTHPVTIHDLRGQEEKFKIHENAFEVVKYTPSITEFTNENIKEHMYTEAADLVKKVTGASTVVCFSHLTRMNTIEDNRKALEALENSSKDEIKDDFGFGKVVPARFAHIDQSGKGAKTLLVDNYPDLAKSVGNKRWGTVNIWRPLKTIKKDPLALCDSQTVDDADLAIVESTLPKKGENAGYYDTVSKGDGFQTLELRHNPKHKWYYMSNLQPDECLMFKIYDSVSGRCGHTSFEDPNTKADEPVRESMEMRFFLVYDE